MNEFDTFMDFILSPKCYVPIVVFLLDFIIIKILSKAIKKILINDPNKLEEKKRNTIVVLVSNILRYVLILVGICVVLATYGVNVRGILAGLGIAGAIAGLAFQDLLKDIISGCNIIMDNYFIIGDLVKINDFTGYVIEFGLKNTKVKDFEGNVLVISNREISHIINMSQKHASVPIMVGVSYDATEDDVKKSLNKAMNEINKLDHVIKKCEYAGIEELGDSAVIYVIRVHTNPDYKYEVKRASLAIIKNQFDKDGIKIPYPQVEVHNGKRV